MNKARLLCTAEGSPVELFENIVTVSEAKHMAPRTSSRSRRNDDSNLCVDNELGFAKDRTISRLTEMNSKEPRTTRRGEAAFSAVCQGRCGMKGHRAKMNKNVVNPVGSSRDIHSTMVQPTLVGFVHKSDQNILLCI
ncbi:hypothetical protein F3Y22_tig00111022pilonHSYRG00137 [Hibiscus syriacus]|uniref:Uncharacterized protein n=1 Tax=Hibiscus syriacus TaxID=106335 RepID=A0A6A2Z6U9_HIBSY|nr:hypothetical protein F3Y22_tig00111022pilonHSYRG00137 [Hibiscus syriacus]